MSYSEEPTAGISEVTRILFFDNGFFRALLKGDFRDEMGDLVPDVLSELKIPFTSWRTAFSFMEWIGLNSEDFDMPKKFDPASVVGTEFIVPAFHHYERHYAGVAQLDREMLEIKAYEQRGHVYQGFLNIWDKSMDGIFGDTDTSSWLRFALAFDAVHKLDVHKDHSQDYWHGLLLHSFFGCDYRVRNLSKFRLACRMWLRIRHEAPSDQRASIEETHKLIDLRRWNWKDYLDSDLVHVAAYGVEVSDGTRHRAVCLTCDRPEEVIMRIRLYKGLLSSVRKLYREEADADGYPNDFESSHNGTVLCFDLTGTLVRRIEVSIETPPLPFLGKTS